MLRADALYHGPRAGPSYWPKAARHVYDSPGSLTDGTVPAGGGASLRKRPLPPGGCSAPNVAGAVRAFVSALPPADGRCGLVYVCPRSSILRQGIGKVSDRFIAYYMITVNLMVKGRSHRCSC